MLCNFDEFWVYDFDKQLDAPMDRVKIDDLPHRWEALSFLLPEAPPPVFGNDLGAVYEVGERVPGGVSVPGHGEVSGR